MKSKNLVFPVALLAVLALSGTTSAQPRSERTALVGARIYTSPDAAAIENGTILIDGEHIKAVGSSSALRVPRGYQVVDLAGATVTAGFWNSHVHLTTPTLLRASTATDTEITAEMARTFGKWGFTTVMDLASTSSIAGTIKSRMAAGRLSGPRVLSAGEPFYPADATPIYARPFYEAMKLPSAEVATAEAATARARAQLRAGADGLKLFSGSIVGGEPKDVVPMPMPIAVAVVREAHKAGKRVFAHPTNRAGLEVAVNSGVDALAHSAPLMGAWTAAEARRIVNRRMALIPTLSLFAGEPNPATPVAVAVDQARTYSKEGGLVLFGTDAGFTDQFDTAQELRLMAEALGWRGVLASLTTNPAQFFGESTRRGKLGRGYRAELVVVDGDPALDVTALAKVRGVMRDGRWIYTGWGLGRAAQGKSPAK